MKSRGGTELLDKLDKPLKLSIETQFDDKLLKKCAKYDIKVWCGSPVLFCTEEDLR